MSVEGTPISDPGSDSFGTRAGTEQKVGARNLFEYENIERGNPEATTTTNAVSAAIADDLEEANADMAEAWLTWQGTDFIPIGYSLPHELRWLNDTAEYGACAKAWAGRNVGRAQSDAVPQQIATALKEWDDRLTMLRTGAVLKAYYATESDEEDIGILALQEGLGPVAKLSCPSTCCQTIDPNLYDCA